MTFWKWSRTAASNSNADATINWAEGQSPSSINDSGRAMMAAAAKYRDDISGAVATSGVADAYTLSTFQVFTSLANMDGKLVAFTPHATNEDAPTLNVDSLGAKDIRGASGEALAAGVLIQGTPYQALYSNANDEFVLVGFYYDPYNVPVTGGFDYWGTADTIPSSIFAMPYAQAISRTTYSVCFNRMGTTYGAGDGSTTFNLPDKQGRVSVGKDDMSGTSANRLTAQTGGVNGDTLGATGGEETVTLEDTMVPATDVTIVITDPGHTHTNGTFVPSNQTQAGPNPPGGSVGSANTGSSTTGITAAGTVDGGGDPHNNVQPSIVCNYIIRVI